MRTGMKAGGLTGAAVIVMLILYGFTGGFEGNKLKAYYDIGNVATICRGHTQGVKITDVKTAAECDQIFKDDLWMYMGGVQQLVAREDMPLEVWAAYSDFAFNVGLGAFAGSTMLKQARAGQWAASCQEFPRWKYAGYLPDGSRRDCSIRKNNCYGIIKRREAERALCLQGVSHAR